MDTHPSYLTEGQKNMILPPFISDRRTKEHDTPSLREGRGGLPSSLRKGWGGLPLILSERLRVLAHASEQSSSGRAMLG